MPEGLWMVAFGYQMRLIKAMFVFPGSEIRSRRTDRAGGRIQSATRVLS
jgi:hypothetical protein